MLLIECNALWPADLATPSVRPLDPDPMQAESADSAGLTRFPIRPATFARSAGPPEGQSRTRTPDTYMYIQTGGSICTIGSLADRSQLVECNALWLADLDTPR